jgi:hypothetical protein
LREAVSLLVKRIHRIGFLVVAWCWH